jgi:predicted GNAT family N-acyltransferase
MPQSIKSPAACKPQELENFKTLLLASELEGADGLAERIRQAELLAFQYDDNKQLIAIAALKRANEGYLKGVFKKAALPEREANYPLEFGWVVIAKEYRSKGLGSGLLRRLLQKAARQNIFAITRSSDKEMAASLAQQGFVATGQPYSRRTHRYTYQLFLREGQEQVVEQESR